MKIQTTTMKMYKVYKKCFLTHTAWHQYILHTNFKLPIYPVIRRADQIAGIINSPSYYHSTIYLKHMGKDNDEWFQTSKT